MEKVPTATQMAESIRESIKTTKNTATASMSGLMARPTKATGRTTKDMDKADSPTQQVRAELEFGSKVKEWNGSLAV